MFSCNQKTFLRFVTVDERWIHHNTPETMDTVFWDAYGAVYIEKGKTITGEDYLELLKKFDIDLIKAKKEVLFQQDNALMHTCVVTWENIYKLVYKFLPYLAYFPDLAFCGYFLFSFQPLEIGW